MIYTNKAHLFSPESSTHYRQFWVNFDYYKKETVAFVTSIVFSYCFLAIVFVVEKFFKNFSTTLADLLQRGSFPKDSNNTCILSAPLSFRK